MGKYLPNTKTPEEIVEMHRARRQVEPPVIPPNVQDLANELTEMLAHSIYYAAFGMGETATEMNEFKQRAEMYYLNNPKFNALVKTLVYNIVDKCHQYKQAV